MSSLTQLQLQDGLLFGHEFGPVTGWRCQLPKHQQCRILTVAGRKLVGYHSTLTLQEFLLQQVYFLTFLLY